MSDLPAVPETRDDLFIAAMRHANEVSGLLNQMSSELMKLTDAEPESKKYDGLHDLLLTRFGKHSALHLFIAAGNLGVELPPDLQGEAEDEPE
jgi:hypothetical protein